MLKSDADKAVPQKLLDAIDFIEMVMAESSWQKIIKKESKFLTELFGKAEFIFKDEDSRDVVSYK
jgi:hypothetical protein